MQTTKEVNQARRAGGVQAGQAGGVQAEPGQGVCGRAQDV